MTPDDVETPNHALWHQGWYRFARHAESPNFGPRPAQVNVDLIVIHSISLPPGQFDTGDVQRLFTNTLEWDAHPYFETLRDLKVSAHFFITRTGGLWQFVSVDDRAWHAGESFYRGKGNCNDNSIGIELEGLEGDAFEAAQYDSLSALCAALLERLPIDHIAGHEHIALGRKRDPGPGFDWTQLQSSLGLPPHHFPAKT